MSEALVIRAPRSLSAPGTAPRIIAALPIAGAAVRYVAASITQAEGTAVASWPELDGGAALLQSTVAAQPTFTLDDGGTPSVVLDGVDDYLAATYTAPGQARTIILYAKMRSLPAASSFLYYTALRSSSGINSMTLFDTTGRLLAQGQSGVGNAGTAVTVNTGWHMVAAILKGAGSTVIRDTTAHAGADSGTLSTADILRIGKGSSGATSPLSVKEIIVYESALTTGQVEQIRAFLAEQYA